MLRKGYVVYLLASFENDVIGTATLSSGGNSRYPFSTENDIILGPYFVLPEYRRQGMASTMLNQCLAIYKGKVNKVFAHVYFKNLASINCLSKLGFHSNGNYMAKKFSHKLALSGDGTLILMEKNI